MTMFGDDLMPALDLIGEGHPEWSQQDGATPHYAIVVRDWLGDKFPQLDWTTWPCGVSSKVAKFEPS
jgi:hypothetical protein